MNVHDLRDIHIYDIKVHLLCSKDFSVISFNRDPNQKMLIEMLYVISNDRVSNFNLNGLLFFLGQQYRVNWITERRCKQLSFPIT